MIGHILLVHDTIAAAVAGDDVVRVAAVGAPPVGKTLPFGNHPQCGLPTEFGCMHNDVVCMDTLDFWITGVQVRTVIDDGALEGTAAILPGCGAYIGQAQQHNHKNSGKGWAQGSGSMPMQSHIKTFNPHSDSFRPMRMFTFLLQSLDMEGY